MNNRGNRLYLALLLQVILLAVIFPATALAAEITTVIDVEYSFTKDNDAGLITKTKDLTQTYEIDYTASPGSYYDFHGRLAVDFDIQTETDQPTKKILTPTLDLELSGEHFALATSFESTRDETERYENQPSTTSYSNTFDVDLDLTPDRLPHTRFRWQRSGDFEEQTLERIKKSLEIEMDYQVRDLDVEFNYASENDEELLPGTSETNTDEWQLKLTYGRTFSRLLDLQLEYDIQESFSEDTGKNGVFVSEDKDYTQTLAAGLRSSFEILNEFDVDLDYDFDFEQDFLEKDFKYEISHSVGASIEREFLNWISAAVEYSGTNEKTVAVEGEEDEETVKSEFSGDIRARPWDWLDITSTAERDFEWTLNQNTGGTVEKTEDRKYETTVSTAYQDFLKLQGTHSYDESFTFNLLESKRTEYQFDAIVEMWDFLSVDSTFDISLEKLYDTDSPVYILDSTTREWEAELTFSFNKVWRDMLGIIAEYSFSYTDSQELDSVGNLEEEATLSEDGSFVVTLSEWIRGMDLEFEVTRKATDTRGDEEPMIIDKTYSVKLDWVLDELLISSTYNFDDKGDADNSMSFDAKVSWQKEFYEITGEYQFEKTFSEEISETESYDLSLKLIF